MRKIPSKIVELRDVDDVNSVPDDNNDWDAMLLVQVMQSYDMLHVSPPMNTPPVLGENKDLSDEAGFLAVNKETLQHVR